LFGVGIEMKIKNEERYNELGELTCFERGMNNTRNEVFNYNEDMIFINRSLYDSESYTYY
jgi:hypothetical protein